MTPKRALLGIVAALLVVAPVAGCARAVAVESQLSGSFPLEVINATGEDLLVSYDDGTGGRLLGAVTAGSQMRFTITGPATSRITVTATNKSGTRTIRKVVTLSPGGVSTVRLTG